MHACVLIWGTAGLVVAAWPDGGGSHGQGQGGVGPRTGRGREVMVGWRAAEEGAPSAGGRRSREPCVRSACTRRMGNGASSFGRSLVRCSRLSTAQGTSWGGICRRHGPRDYAAAAGDRPTRVLAVHGARVWWQWGSGEGRRSRCCARLRAGRMLGGAGARQIDIALRWSWHQPSSRAPRRGVRVRIH